MHFLKEIHEVELSSRCNLACVYCPHPTMQREKADMSWSVFQRTMKHVAHYVKQGTQGELALTGIGEALLHPQFLDILFLARSVIGYGRSLTVSTNGVEVTDEVAVGLRRAQAQVYVSLHRPEVAGPAIHRLKSQGVSVVANKAFVDSSLDWAGQVSWHVSAPVHDCDYLGKGWGVVRQNGSVDMCCMDAGDLHPVGHVFADPGTLRRHVTPLCSTCHLRVPQELRAKEVA